jgi:hypothetical protein
VFRSGGVRELHLLYIGTKGAGKFCSQREEIQSQLLLMMKGLFWNIMRMGKKGIGPYVRELLSERKFDFVCVQETILHDFSEKWLRKETILHDFSEKWLRKFDPKVNYL